MVIHHNSLRWISLCTISNRLVIKAVLYFLVYLNDFDIYLYKQSDRTGCKLWQGVYKTDSDGVEIVDGKCIGYHGGTGSTPVKVSSNIPPL